MGIYTSPSSLNSVEAELSFKNLPSEILDPKKQCAVFLALLLPIHLNDQDLVLVFQDCSADVVQGSYTGHPSTKIGCMNGNLNLPLGLRDAKWAMV